MKDISVSTTNERHFYITLCFGPSYDTKSTYNEFTYCTLLCHSNLNLWCLLVVVT